MKQYILEPKRKSLIRKIINLIISKNLRRLLRRKPILISLNNYNKAESLEKYKVKATTGEKIVYVTMIVNVAIPCTAFPITNPLLYKGARRLGIVR